MLMRSLVDAIAKAVNRPSIGGGVAMVTSTISGPAGGTLAYLQAYGSVGWLFACVSRICEAVSSIEWSLYRCKPDGSRELAMGHAALGLWRDANPFLTGQEFVETFQQHLDLVGEAWWLLVRDGRGRVVELWPLRPDRMSPIPHLTEWLQGYRYRAGAVTLDLRPEDIIFLRRPNPTDSYRGIGPVQTIMADLDSERYSAQWNRAFFLNSAEPGGIIETPETLSDAQFEEVLLRWRLQHQGVTNAHRVAILEGGAKWVDRRYTMRDMQFRELRQVNRDTILGAYGMPLHLLGIAECFPTDHELLTRNGWQGPDYLQVGMEVAAFNLDTGTVEYQPILRVHRYPYTGELVHFGGRRMDLDVTPGHRMLVRLNNCRALDNRGSYQELIAEAVEGRAVTYLPLAGLPIPGGQGEDVFIPKVAYGRTGKKGYEPAGDGYRVSRKLLARFCGLWASEGWMKGGRSCDVVLAQAVRHGEVVRAIEDVLEQLPFGQWRVSRRPMFNHRKEGAYTGDILLWRLANKTLHHWLHAEVGCGASEKRVPQFVLEGDVATQQAFLGAYILGDGHLYHEGCIGIRTSSRKMVDGLEAIGVHLGLTTSVNRSGDYPMVIFTARSDAYVRRANVSRKSYEGDVWCVEVPSTFLFVRHNHRICITGNSVNRANAEAAEVMFGRWVVRPRLERIRGALNERLLPAMGFDGYEFDFTDPVPADRAIDLEVAAKGYQLGFLQRNEARRLVGFGVIEGEDAFNPLAGMALGASSAAKALVPKAAASEGEVEASMTDAWARRLAIEGKAIAEALERMGAKAIVDDLDYNWDWWRKYGEEVIDELIATMLAGLIAEGLGVPPDMGLAQRLATQYARERGAALLRVDGDLNLAASTRRRVGEIIAEGIEQGQSLGKIGRQLREDFAFSRKRAETIARTETGDAWGWGSIEAGKAQGHDEKRWVTQGVEGVCDLCLANEAAGWIAIADAFPSGHMQVTGHPGCRCRTRTRTSSLFAEGVGTGRGKVPLAEVRCPKCGKLLGYDVVGARFVCPRCKAETVF